MTSGQLVRFDTKVSYTETCWLWTGGRTRAGYGVLGLGGRGDGTAYAHRLSYEHFVGPIPEGLQIDHLCRNRSCVNPKHLEPVTHGENIGRGESLPARNARKTHCAHGHPFDDGNTYIIPSTGHRSCIACAKARRKEVTV